MRRVRRDKGREGAGLVEVAAKEGISEVARQADWRVIDVFRWYFEG